MKVLSIIQSWDHLSFRWCMARSCREQMTAASRWLSRTADGPFYLLMGLFWIWQGFSSIAWVMAGAFTAERAVYLLMKQGCRRNRPADILQGFNSFIIPSDRFSFPSGHTSGAFLMSIFLIHMYPGFALPVLCWAVSVAVSRVFLGVHFPSDTVVGGLLGSTTGILMLENCL